MENLTLSYLLSLPLLECIKDLKSIQDNLLLYKNRQVITFRNGYKLGEKETLKNLYIGAIYNNYTGYSPLVISYHSDCHLWHKDFKCLKISMNQNELVCENGDIKYEFKFS